MKRRRVEFVGGPFDGSFRTVDGPEYVTAMVRSRPVPDKPWLDESRKVRYTLGCDGRYHFASWVVDGPGCSAEGSGRS